MHEEVEMDIFEEADSILAPMVVEPTEDRSDWVQEVIPVCIASTKSGVTWCAFV
jgi:hypothetical protein